MLDNTSSHIQRNFIINVAEGALFIAGASLMSAQTVLPALISRLGGGNVIIGTVGVLSWMGLFLPQILAARYAQTNQWKKGWAIRLGLSQRIAVLSIALVILIFGRINSTLSLWLLLALYLVHQLLIGIATPFWFDMYAKLTPVGLRGRLSGFRNSLAGIGSFVSAFLLTWLLANFAFPVNYSLVFSLTFFLQFISIMLQFALVEKEPSKVLPTQSLFNYLKQLRMVLAENAPFKTYILSSMFLILAIMPLSFFTIYGLKRFSTDESIVGQFTFMMVIGQGVGALFNGYVADRYGNKLALISAASAMLFANMFALLAPTLGWFWLAFIFMGINLGSELMIRYNLALEYSPVEQRSAYIGLMNTILAPLYLSGLLGGWISDMFGYQSVFLIGSFFSFTGIILLIIFVHEPRLIHALLENDRAS